MQDSGGIPGGRSALNNPTVFRRSDGGAVIAAGTNVGEGSDLSGSLEVIFDFIKSDAENLQQPGIKALSGGGDHPAKLALSLKAAWMQMQPFSGKPIIPNDPH